MTKASLFASRVMLLVTLFSLLTMGCAGPRTGPTGSADSTGTVQGDFFSTFVHGDPFYGSVVCLVEVTPHSVEWWKELASRPAPVVYPERDSRLNVVGRTVSAYAPGDPSLFSFSNVPPGTYLVYARVFWAESSSEIAGDGYGAVTTVAARETVHVTLRSPRRSGFDPNALHAYMSKGPAPNESGLPKFGESVNVEELPEPMTIVPPAYPDAARRSGITGTVIVNVLVGRDGRVKDARLANSIPTLDGAALMAARRYVFKPAMTANQPVAAWTQVQIHFPPPSTQSIR